MARRSRKGRDINGIVVIDKPTGVSSNKILQQVKRLFDARKAGHTGNLDPLATGVLPICLGEATKLSGYMLDSDKQYLVTCQLGTVTDSGDSDGEVISQSPLVDYSETDLQQITMRFIGKQQQVPPMFSALKHQGQPLYKLARQGIEVERKAREIEIYAIEIIDCNRQQFTLSVSCSKGTYIRTLVEDISAELGCGGHVVMLMRTAAAGYHLEDSVSLEQVQQKAEQQGFVALDKLLLPAEQALADWPALYVNEQAAQQLRYGQHISTDVDYQCANIRLFDNNDSFMGLGEMTPDGTVAPKRLFVSYSEQ